MHLNVCSILWAYFLMKAKLKKLFMTYQIEFVE